MIFFDRSVPKSVAEALKLVREDEIAWLDDHFNHWTPDEEWLEVAGRNGWLVISRDKRIRTRPGERTAIQLHSVGCFILNQRRGLTRWEYLKILAHTLDEIVECFAATPRPFIYIVYSSGEMRRVL